MIGGQHDDIIDVLTVQDVEKIAHGLVECAHLDAHFETGSTESVADIIGCGQADRQNIGGLSLTQLVIIHQCRCRGKNRSVKIGRSAEDLRRAVGALECVITNGFVIAMRDFCVARLAMGGNRIGPDGPC